MTQPAHHTLTTCQVGTVHTVTDSTGSRIGSRLLDAAGQPITELTRTEWNFIHAQPIGTQVAITRSMLAWPPDTPPAD